ACPDGNRVVAFLNGSLPEQAGAEVEAHLDVCPACQELMALLGKSSMVGSPSRSILAVNPDHALSGPDPGAGRTRASTILARGALVERYIILDVLGAGGMGLVYAAYDSELNRKIALKLLHSTADSVDGVADGQERLLREARSLAQLSHPNVIAV